jgi:hypothetical protein
MPVSIEYMLDTVSRESQAAISRMIFAAARRNALYVFVGE